MASAKIRNNTILRMKTIGIMNKVDFINKDYRNRSKCSQYSFIKSFLNRKLFKLFLFIFSSATVKRDS